MRVIAGALRGRALQAPRGLSVRPTSDALRETLFNICGPAVVGSVWVDCCAGSGAVGIEALSRGAKRVFFIEPARAARTALQTNLVRLGLSGARGLSRRFELARAGLRLLFLGSTLCRASPLRGRIGTLGRRGGVAGPGGLGDRRARAPRRSGGGPRSPAAFSPPAAGR